MKRSTSGPGTSSGNPYAKKPRNVDFDEDGPSFEDELGMMDDGGFDETIGQVEGSEVFENQESRWSRPVSTENASISDLSFHWFDIDMTTSAPLLNNPDGKGKVLGSTEVVCPVVRMYGVTSQGQSVMAWVHGFTPYFYVSLPNPIKDSSDPTGNIKLGQLRLAINQRVSFIWCHYWLQCQFYLS